MEGLVAGFVQTTGQASKLGFEAWLTQSSCTKFGTTAKNLHLYFLLSVDLHRRHLCLVATSVVDTV